MVFSVLVESESSANIFPVYFYLCFGYHFGILVIHGEKNGEHRFRQGKLSLFPLVDYQGLDCPIIECSTIVSFGCFMATGSVQFLDLEYHGHLLLVYVKSENYWRRTRISCDVFLNWDCISFLDLPAALRCKYLLCCACNFVSRGG